MLDPSVPKMVSLFSAYMPLGFAPPFATRTFVVSHAFVTKPLDGSLAAPSSASKAQGSLVDVGSGAQFWWGGAQADRRSVFPLFGPLPFQVFLGRLERIRVL